MPLHATMDITESKYTDSAHAYRDIFEQFVTEASFLWLLRSVGLEQPNYTAVDIAEQEMRIAAQLDGLMTAIDLGWEHCLEALELGDPGEQFTASVVAFRSHEMHKIQTVVESGLTNLRMTKGLISAMGWIKPDIAQQWIGKFVNGKDLNHKYLGIAACSIRRHDPDEVLTTILNREDCQQHTTLYARALRLVGELRRLDLIGALQIAAHSQEPDVTFWANWSAILLGEHAVAEKLQPIVFSRGPHQERAIQLAFRVLPIEQGREWISSLAKDPINIRAVIKASGVLGDPHAVNWLISKMADPLLARLAAEAFTNITGVDLLKHHLNEDPHYGEVLIPNDDENDAHVGMDEDENLPWPEVEKVATLWRNHGANFIVGRRYFLGKSVTPELLKQTIADGNMRQRHAAALELALIDPQSRLINTRAKVMP